MLAPALFVAALAQAGGPASRETAIVLIDGSTAPVVWNSTVRATADEGEVVDIGVCWKGVEEDCEEGLSTMATPGHKCDVMTADCQCYQWVLSQDDHYPAGVSVRRAAESPSCAVVSITRSAQEHQAVDVWLEHSLANHTHRFLTLGGKIALDTEYSEAWGEDGEGPVLKRDFYARHAAAWCDQQRHNNDTRASHHAGWAPSCPQGVPFLLKIRLEDTWTDPYRTFHAVWPALLVFACFGAISLQKWQETKNL